VSGVRTDFWPAVEALFTEVVDADPGDRSLALEQHRRGDPAVVEEVESLLAAHAHAGEFLAVPLPQAEAGIHFATIRPDSESATLAGAPPARADAPPRRRAAGEVIGHYRLCEWLGSGGMGEVYRADDLALARPVALKLLPLHVDPDFRRVLLREAAASARLQHPGIATFYEVGEADGEAFFAMEFIEGESLRNRLIEGPLPLPQAMAIARSLLEALHHAHSAGVLHRDIKPENIMLGRDAAPKLLDFGIAALVRASDDVASTGLDSRLRFAGTPAYLPPEHFTGEGLDVCGDLYQVGVVLCEMVTGRNSFGALSISERFDTGTTDRLDLDTVRDAGVPGELMQVLERVLSPRPSDRYDSASTFLRELKNLAGLGRRPSPLAVLDFREHEGGPDDVWIGSGVAESLFAALERVTDLALVPREKTLHALPKGPPGSDVLAESMHAGGILGCRTLLTGTFHRRGEMLRLTATLVDVSIGQIIGTEHVEGPIEGLGVLQARLLHGVIDLLHLQPLNTSASADHDVKAFECYARGRRLWQRLEKGTMDQARELYARAVEIDPHHARALSGLAAVYAMRFPYTTDPEDLLKAEHYAQRAIEEDSTLGDPYAWLGYAMMRQHRLDEALDAELRGAALDPDHPYPPYFAGCVQYFAGRPQLAVPFLRRAIEVGPTHAFAWMVLGHVHTSLENFAAAHWCFEQAAALEHPGAAGPAVGVAAYVAECLRREGRLDEARAACMDALEATQRSDHMYRDTIRGLALCCLARTAFDQDDVPAARTALLQVLGHVRGRDRMLGGGHLVVQALAGLARAGDGRGSYDEAVRLWETRRGFDFSLGFACDAATTVTALAQAALALDLPGASALFEQACAAGSAEAGRALEQQRRLRQLPRSVRETCC
jgi:tetratricopeptide (TPR) repeat protein/TolB-like protein/predicted Ser/Thr protein kinase